MHDASIIRLFQNRDESAISEVKAEYGSVCERAARNLLGDAHSAEEAFSDALMALWNSIPPENPRSLKAYVLGITRKCALKAYREKTAKKRGGNIRIESLDELAAYIPGGEGAVALSPNKTRPGDPQGLPGLLLSCIINLAEKPHRKQGYCTMKARGNQVVLPINVASIIEEGDPVFKMAEILGELDYRKLRRTYKRRWRSISPEIMFSIVVFANMKGIYSSRGIEEACKTDIRFMRLLQYHKAPDHTTIARFFENNMSGCAEDLFYQLTEKLAEMGEIDFEALFIDGTKIESYYVCESCAGCPFREKCFKGQYENRKIELSKTMRRQKEEAEKRISTPKGILLRVNRSIQVEGAFGVLKQDYGFRRFITLGKKNNETRLFILAMAFNIQKLCSRIANGRLGKALFDLIAA